ncbi:MAG: hypothetical protein M1819_006001 [Sarea resinae]|nr:MAG: hypothetical protein M1819_006001 [Sarea resinae]
MASWATIKTLLLTLGPIFLPRLISWARALLHTYRTNTLPPLSTPRRTSYALYLLATSTILALLSSLPILHPRDVFTQTSSRLQTPTDVIFTRLRNLNPSSVTASAFAAEQETFLRPFLQTLDGRLLYLTFGPQTLTACPFCSTDDPTSYIYYAVPTILVPHLFHLFLLGLVTPQFFSPAPSATINNTTTDFRTPFTAAGAFLALADVALLANHDPRSANLRGSNYIDAFHWRLSTYRGLSIAFVDALLAWCLYLRSTQRFFVSTSAFSISTRLEAATAALEAANRKLSALGIVRNVVNRDAMLRQRVQGYWMAEGNIMGEVYEDREVVEGVKGALGRLDVGSLELEAGKYAERVVGGVSGTWGGVNGSSATASDGAGEGAS